MNITSLADPNERSIPIAIVISNKKDTNQWKESIKVGLEF
jgi:hypothetical protein